LDVGPQTYRRVDGSQTRAALEPQFKHVMISQKSGGWAALYLTSVALLFIFG